MQDPQMFWVCCLKTPQSAPVKWLSRHILGAGKPPPAVFHGPPDRLGALHVAFLPERETERGFRCPIRRH